MAATEAQVAALVAAQAAAREKLADATSGAVAGVVSRFSAWYADGEAEKLAATLAKLTRSGQRQTAAITDAYLARVLSVLTGRRYKPTGVVPVDGLRTGVTSQEAYDRLARKYRYLVAEGTETAAALRQVTERGSVMAGMDLQLAHRAQFEKAVAEHPEITAWRRIVRPELSAGGTCGLCVVAADRLYYRSDLLAVHERCKCEVLPVVGEQDPGLNLNATDLQAFYDAAGSTSGKDLKRVRISVERHGELGNVLREDGQHFRDAEEAAAA